MNLWPGMDGVAADGVDGAGGSVSVLLSGLHSYRW